METFAHRAIQFHSRLNLNLPDDGIEVLNPFKNHRVRELIGVFFMKYFSDTFPRTFIFGINPGRFGAGITGISFTDPVNLEEKCGIENDFDKRHELSSQFIYKVVEAFGGAEKFYRSFFMTAISPLGFVKNGKNINYYDDKKLQESVAPFIRDSMIEQVQLGARRRCAICVGGGKNFKYMNKINETLNLFDRIIPLDHPRFVMQYRRKAMDQYVNKYLEALNLCEVINQA